MFSFGSGKEGDAVSPGIVAAAPMPLQAFVP
jgi:hypothetical protein